MLGVFYVFSYSIYYALEATVYSGLKASNNISKEK